jgi:hypothetical protein
MTEPVPMPIAPAVDSSRWRVRSRFSVPKTVRRLETVIQLHPDIRLLARIDQAETVAAAGGSARPITAPRHVDSPDRRTGLASWAFPHPNRWFTVLLVPHEEPVDEAGFVTLYERVVPADMRERNA